MEELPDNKIDLIYRIDLGNKSKIKKISLEIIDNRLNEFKFIKSLKNFKTNLIN